MPELPEVQSYKSFFDGCALFKKIEQVEIQDARIIRHSDPEYFVENLEEKSFIGSYRRGKYLFAQLDDHSYMLLHFGMTGDLNFYFTEDARTKHERLRFVFSDGSMLGFDCPRMFARIMYIPDLDVFIKEKNIGQDALEITEDTFLKLIKGKKGSLKGFLLNQKIIAGVGNLYADEICFQTRVHPASVAGALSTVKKKAIFQKMQDILHLAIDRGAYYKYYPEGWFWEWRIEGAKGPEGKGIIETAQIAGRTTYFCRKWQRLYV